MLPFLVLVPLLALLYARMQRRRRDQGDRLGSLARVRDELGRALGTRRHISAAMLLLGVTILLCALARPEARLGVPKREGTLVLAFDVSASMGAKDIEPSRLEAAKAVALEFLSRQPPSVEIGVVSFADGGFSVQVPTTEHERVAAAIDRLSPQGGTSIGQGILVALNSVSIAAGEPPLFGVGGTPIPTSPSPHSGSNRSAAIVLLTDGENAGLPDPALAAQAAADRGVRIYSVGVGSPAGAVLEVDGFLVHTTMDEAQLRQIAEVAAGAYYNAQSADDLREIYQRIEPELRIETEDVEITSLLAAAGLAILLTGGLLSLLWMRKMP
jgi:Ca-activated chloride channel family protein